MASFNRAGVRAARLCRRSCGVVTLCAILCVLTPAGRLYPQGPQKPSGQTKEKPQQEKSTDKSPEKPQEKTAEFRRTVKAVLGDGRVVKGSAVLAGPEVIKVKHVRSGIAYDRDLKPGEIVSIEVKRWKAHYVRENKEGKVYEFRPMEYIIQAKDGPLLQVPADQLAFLKQIRMENENGKVTLYFIWMDLLRENGTWHTGLPGSPEKPRNTCHPDTIRKLEVSADH